MHIEASFGYIPFEVSDGFMKTVDSHITRKFYEILYKICLILFSDTSLNPSFDLAIEFRTY